MSACVGDSTKMKTAPIAPPMTPPTIGISPVKTTIAETIAACEMPNRIIPVKSPIIKIKESSI